MMRATIAAGVLVTILGLVALATGQATPENGTDADASVRLATTSSPTDAGEGALYGRVITDGGDVYEGRLRFGGDEEAFWGHYFNGSRAGNPWAVHVPAGKLEERVPIEILGIELPGWKRSIDLQRPFMVRFGDIARIDARGRDLRVTMRSGTVFELDRYEADDFADGVRVWDRGRGVVDLGERDVRSIEFLPTPLLDDVPARLHGTVRTRYGDFTGFIQWDREASVGLDELEGQTAEGAVYLRFATVESIARRSTGGSLVTLLDGREITLSNTRDAGRGNRGIYVDDPRYGRVLVSWDAFERLDFHPGGKSPAYGHFPPGRPLTGSVTTREGRRLTGRLVYDLDESETTETLDAPDRGVDYTIPFGLIASIVPTGPAARALVTLHDGRELRLERAGDLHERNGGILVFTEEDANPTYVTWADVERIDLDRPPEADPPIDAG